MSNYEIHYTATDGSGIIGMDGTNDRKNPPPSAESKYGGAVRQKGERYSYRLVYDCSPEEQLDRYLTATVTTRIYRTDFETSEIKELFTKNRPYPMVHQIGQIYDGRWLCQIATPGGNHQSPWLVDEDGERWEPLTPPEEAFIYGININSAKDLLAFHVTSKHYDEVYDYMPNPYSINTIDLRTGKRTLVDTREGGLLFGPAFSPDEQWLLYVDCDRIHDPAHFFGDLCIARPDGSEVRHLTQGYAFYFGTAFGPADHRRGGSNTPVWLDDHTVLFPKRSPDAHPDAGYDASLGDHKEEYYDPSLAKGGCQLVTLDIDTGKETPITPFEEGKWDFRPRISPDKQWIAYISVRSGGYPSELRVCKIDGTEDRFLTCGYNGFGVDHPVFSEIGE